MDIVCVALPAFDGNYVKSTVELMTELAVRHRVLYLDYAYTWSDLFRAIFKNTNKLSVTRLLGIRRRLVVRQLANGASIFLLTPPPIIPSNFLPEGKLYQCLMAFNGWLVKKTIQKSMKRLGFNKPLVVNAFNPYLGNPLANKLEESKLVYYCYDEISACNWTKKHGGKLEQDFMLKVDAVIVSSEGLYHSKNQYNKNCYTIKNGVKMDFLQSKIGLEIPQNEPMRLGYIGSIDSRIDYDLLIEIVTQNPDKELVMVGRVVFDKPTVVINIERLSAFANVRFEGVKETTILASYLSSFTVGLIPFVKNIQTSVIYPLKINEYLAAGLAVVSTNFAPLSEFEEVVAFAEDTKSFCEKITEVIAEDSPEMKKKRHAFATQNTWPKRAEEFEKILKQLF